MDPFKLLIHFKSCRMLYVVFKYSGNFYFLLSTFRISGFKIRCAHFPSMFVSFLFFFPEGRKSLLINLQVKMKHNGETRKLILENLD